LSNSHNRNKGENALSFDKSFLFDLRCKKTTFFSSSKKKVALWDKKRRAVELPTDLRMNYELGIILLKE